MVEGVVARTQRAGLCGLDGVLGGAWAGDEDHCKKVTSGVLFGCFFECYAVAPFVSLQ